MNDLLDGMVRRPDHSTSVMAAQRVDRKTCREIVIEFALAAGPSGFIDDDLKAAWPDMAESTLRKRRTDMTVENRIIETGRTRTNRNNREERVWVHRQFHHNPPPIVVPEPKISRADMIVRLEAEIKRLKRLLADNNITY